MVNRFWRATNGSPPEERCLRHSNIRLNKRDEVTAEAFAVMEKQSKARMNVRLFFSDESRLFSFPADISKDFTVVDHGEAIGTTISFGGDSLAAEWYIQDQDRKRRFEGICKSLTQGSEEFSKFREWWKKRP